MLTIFGKKKKDETGDATKEGQAPSPPTPIPAPITPAPASIASSGQGPSAKPTSTPPKPVQNPSQQQPMARPPAPQPIFRPPPYAPLPSEETSLTKVLQSLLQDVSLPPDIASTFGGVTESTPDYVPARPTPPSRPMVIGPRRDSGEWEEQEEEPAKPTSTPAAKPKPPDIQPQVKVSPPPPPVAPKRDQPAEKAPEKPSKVEKQPEKPEKPSKEAPKQTRTPQSFDHIFELTKGNLENPGFVIINGVEGSGRTTLCSGLTGNYMKNENPCIYLTYDQSPEELRGQIKKLGTDPAKYESRFRFILIDGYSSQSEAFSMEPYYVEQPFSFESVREAVERNSEFFVGEKTKIIFDSLDRLVAKSTVKDLAKNLGDLVQKMKDAGATFIVSVDMSGVPKDMAGSLNDMADCVIELSKDDSDPEGRQLKVQRLNHSSAKVDPETFEVDENKGLVFV